MLQRTRGRPFKCLSASRVVDEEDRPGSIPRRRWTAVSVRGRVSAYYFHDAKAPHFLQHGCESIAALVYRPNVGTKEDAPCEKIVVHGRREVRGPVQELLYDPLSDVHSQCAVQVVKPHCSLSAATGRRRRRRCVRSSHLCSARCVRVV